MKGKHDKADGAKETITERLRKAYDALVARGETNRRLAQHIVGELLAELDQAEGIGNGKAHTK